MAFGHFIREKEIALCSFGGALLRPLTISLTVSFRVLSTTGWWLWPTGDSTGVDKRHGDSSTRVGGN